MIYNENTGPLTDDHDGDTVVIQSNLGRNKDKNWVRNFTKAKELAATGRIHRIVARVTADKEHLRTLYAFREAVGTGHPLLEVCVVGNRPEDVVYIREKVHLPLACEGKCDLCTPRKRGRPKKVVEPVEPPKESSVQIVPIVEGFTQRLKADLEPSIEDTQAFDIQAFLNDE